jgi:hypothetical protein
MKESWQELKVLSATDTERCAASIFHQSFLDMQAERRDKLKAGGKMGRQ